MGSRSCLGPQLVTAPRELQVPACAWPCPQVCGEERLGWGMTTEADVSATAELSIYLCPALGNWELGCLPSKQKPPKP